MRRSLLGLVSVLVGLVVLLAADTAGASMPFQPSYNLLSVSPSTPGANGTVVQSMSVPAGDHVIGYLQFRLPQTWDVRPVTLNARVGSGQLTVDVDCNGSPDSYTLIITDEGRIGSDPPDVETRWKALGYPFQQFTFDVKTSPTGQILETLLFTTDTICVLSPMSLNLTFSGMSSDNPQTTPVEPSEPVMVNPAAGVYTWSAEMWSKPITEGLRHEITRCDQVGIGSAAPDPDGDGIAGSCDNCPATPNTDQRDDDLDGAGNPCDNDDDNDGICDPGASGPPCTGSDACPNTAAGASVDSNGCAQLQVDNDLDGVCDPGKSSPMWCTGSDNCPYIENPSQADWNSNGIGDACDDSDIDGWADVIDNCRTVFNPAQENFDGDALGDVCDPDDDNDSWTDAQEEGNPPGIGLFIGTGARKACASTATAEDEADDGLPADFNDDRTVDITDKGALAGRFGSSQGGPFYLPRFDLNVDTAIDITDLGLVAGRFGQSC